MEGIMPISGGSPEENGGTYCDCCGDPPKPETGPIYCYDGRWICSRCRRTMEARDARRAWVESKAPTPDIADDIEGWCFDATGWEFPNAKVLRPLADEVRRLRAINADLLAAAKATTEAWDQIFGQCASNEIRNTWGEGVSVSKLNDANYLAQKAIAKATNPEGA